MVKFYGRPYRKPTRGKANYRTRVGYSNKRIWKRPKRSAATTKMVQIAKNVVARNQEQKLFVNPLYQNVGIKGFGIEADALAGSAGILKAAVLNSLNMTQGTQQDQRVGNSVKTKSLTFRGVICGTPHSASNSSLLPFEVHLLWYKPKKYTAVTPADIKVANSNTLVPIRNTLINSVYPWNRDKYIIKAHKVFRLRAPPAASTSASGINTQSSNDPYFHRFHVNIPVSKDMIWEDAVTAPSNDWLGFVAYVINADGAALIDTSNVWETRVTLTMDMVYQYTDA